MDIIGLPSILYFANGFSIQFWECSGLLLEKFPIHPCSKNLEDGQDEVPPPILIEQVCLDSSAYL